MFDFVIELTDYWKKLSTMHKALTGIIFVVVAYYLYNWYQTQQQQSSLSQTTASVENYSGGGDGKADVVCTMYYTTWCKYCNKAKPEWEKVMQEFNGKVVNGKKILITKIDCEKEPEIAEQENIKGYPTFKFNMKGKYYDYPDEPVFQKFKTFIEYLVGLRE